MSVSPSIPESVQKRGLNHPQSAFHEVARHGLNTLIGDLIATETPAMTDDCLLPFDLTAIQRKKVTADFTGGTFSSDDGLVLLREVERPLGLTETLASCIREWREATLMVHTLSAMLRFRMSAIKCGH